MNPASSRLVRWNIQGCSPPEIRMSAGIEALATLDSDVREEVFGGVWPLMWGMRNRIAHGYLLVDTTIIRETLIHDIPSIMSRIRRLVVLDQSAAIGDNHATAGGGFAQVDMGLDDPGPAGNGRVGESDRG